LSDATKSEQRDGRGPRAARDVPAIWGNVPQRNKNFTGREDLLTDLRDRVTADVTAVLAHALHGMGGVGKTQLAIEYAYRQMSDYDLIWWVPADQVPLAKSSIAALAPRLGLDDVVPGRVDDAVNAVLDALRRGEPYGRWLLIFDNADQPEDVRELLPVGSGHVIVTSRNHRWQNMADSVEVDVFSRPESLEFLRRRVAGITNAEADRLAEELGDLPLALEQAGALQVEAGMSVEEYLDLLASETTKVLSESRPSDYPVGVAAAWSLSMERVKERTPGAWQLLRRCAFFGAEPIKFDLFKQGRYVLGPPLRDEVGDPIQFGRAIRELGRYALARIDNFHKTLQVHRLIQRLLQDEMSEDEAASLRHEVHLLLAAADPDGPADIDNYPRYDELLAHAIPSHLVACSPDLVDGRRLVRNLVNYLRNIGDLRTADQLSQEALDRWLADSGPDDPDVLMLAGDRANVLWEQGAYEAAHVLRRDTLERMRRVLGEEHDATLAVMNGYGADLRALGDFAGALGNDEGTLALHTRVFGDDDPRTFTVANNVAVSQGLNSDYDAAHETDTRTHDDRLHFYGRNDHPWVVHSYYSIGRDLRLAGRYPEALVIQERAYEDFAGLTRQRIVRADHASVLWQAKELAVVRRKMGLLREALDLADEVMERYSAAYGDDHPDSLAAAMNLGNARRVWGDVNRDEQLMEQAEKLVENAFAAYGEVYGDDHPYTLGCALNLAIVMRRTGDEEGARERLTTAMEGLRGRLGANHHYTQTCGTALATSMAATGDVESARSLGERALAGMRATVGPDHPHTLAAASNLALDLTALGDVEAGEAMAADAIARYRSLGLPDDHLDVQDAVARKRVALDFEPLPL
jgi:tetratricopeptide repeat protein/NB-ARC domain-containing protein